MKKVANWLENHLYDEMARRSERFRLSQTPGSAYRFHGFYPPACTYSPSCWIIAAVSPFTQTPAFVARMKGNKLVASKVFDTVSLRRAHELRRCRLSRRLRSRLKQTRKSNHLSVAAGSPVAGLIYMKEMLRSSTQKYVKTPPPACR